MTDFRADYFAHMGTLEHIQLPNVYRVVSGLLLGLVVVVASVLWFVPWIQTAYGDGTVDTLNPNQRIQAISALVPGQVKEWHVREGQSVEAGDPVVTLVDADPALIERLENQIQAATQQKAAQASALATEQNNLKRQLGLQERGLTSQRDIEKANLEIQKIKAEIAKIDAELNKLKVQKARQSLQTKVAPMSGTILRLLSSGTATYLKPGDVVASFIPDGVKRSAVIMVNGLDATLIQPGREVRLQFDGWPVFQFSGWPDLAVGTFRGIVDFVEPVANEQGQFRVWVKPDPEAAPWPDEEHIRLGSRLRGWVLLEEVRLGYELWRQLNNFPPINPAVNEQS